MDGNIKLFIVRKKEVMIEINCGFELLEIEKDDDADIVDEQKQISNCVALEMSNLTAYAGNNITANIKLCFVCFKSNFNMSPT